MCNAHIKNYVAQCIYSLFLLLADFTVLCKCNGENNLKYAFD